MYSKSDFSYPFTEFSTPLIFHSILNILLSYDECQYQVRSTCDRYNRTCLFYFDRASIFDRTIGVNV